MKSILPIILIILALTGAITYSLAKRTIPTKKVTENFGISANLLESEIATAPSKKVSFDTITGDNAVTPTPTPTPQNTATIMPAVIETEDKATDSSKLASVQTNQVKKTVTTSNLVCTAVYGSANTCTEHITVDTGAENALFFNFAGLAYLGGLVSFAKAKSLKK